MKKSSKLWRNVMIGAAIGAAISLFDRDVRASLWQHRTDDIRQLRQRIQQYRQSLESLREDVIFTAEKIKEIAEKTPEIIEILKETYSWNPQTKK
ncbi:YtxH domain-containing protein [Thermaerobacillus caldiproteolyticus]|uniref:YtxH domain-containing protein n=1 Tax=Thermaerobacillus caldiproteolyticus TaxID=247480 RepID=UPI0018F26947|nr:YtxH domain-containing protein [Anoxybacillus caldiproteolyticus]